MRPKWARPNGECGPGSPTNWGRCGGGREGELGRLFVTEPIDVTTNPSHFYSRVYCKDVSVLTQGPHEVLRDFQRTRDFPRDQRLRLETPGRQLLDFEVNNLSTAELERPRDRIMRVPLVLQDREYPFAEDVIADKSCAVDPNLAAMTKISSRIEVLRLGGNYELVYQLWTHFTLSAVRVNVDVTWSCDDVLLGIFTCSVVCTCH